MYYDSLCNTLSIWAIECKKRRQHCRISTQHLSQKLAGFGENNHGKQSKAPQKLYACIMKEEKEGKKITKCI